MNDRRTPEVRFDGFVEPWLDYTLNEVIHVVERPFVMADDESYQCVTVKRRNEGVVSRGIFNGSAILVKSQFMLKAGDYLISKRQVVHGANGIVPTALDNAIVSNEYLIFQESEKLNMEFLAILSKLPYVYETFFLSSNGVHIEKLLFDFDDWLTRSICIPNKYEQKTLVNFFRNLDDTIAHKKQQYEQTANIKKAMLEKMFPKNGANVPEVRFEGFTGAWEQEHLTDILSPIVGNNTLSRAELNYENGEVKNIHYGDILVKFDAFVDSTSEEIPFITNGTITEYKSILLQDGDIVFADTAEDEAVGKAVEITNTDGINIVAGLHTMVYRPRTKFSPYFAGYYLNANTYRHQLLPLMQGVKVLSLSRSNLDKTLFCYPTSLNEQAAIGDFFRNLDTLIEALREELEKLQNIKKACLSKMFV